MKFYIYNLGCKVNSYESNVMKDNLINNGFVYSSIEEADIVIINSCTVTNSADNKTMKLIRHVRNNFDVILVVVGCFIQAKKDDLSDIPGDILIGNKDKSKIVDIVKNYLKNRSKFKKFYDVSNIEFEDMEVDKFLNKTRGFVKIQDGCNNYCSYCVIPFLRGNNRSKNYEQALDEYKKVFVHEYIHYVNYLFENKHNCSRTARYLVDGIASYLSHQYDNLDADFDYSIEDILGNNCYFGWYLVTKYLIENYTHDYILELFQSSRQARELLINELYDEVKNNRKCDKK